ncbi:hypothetical protein JYU34_010107 [Plutella xylostella]|uniref:Uncharacterized protein n=1 Tax=Plutella xylostella TaxID=51655 RepID=A0ABQ7QHP9_PLUXY|nr:hypothetical protein JYU34_010107 [Plutella xylostella]
MQLAVNMLVNVKYGFLMSEMSPDVDMLRSKEAGYTECAVPRRMRRSFPPILEEKENGSEPLARTFVEDVK